MSTWTEADAERMAWAKANSDRCLNCNVRIVYVPIPNPTGSGFQWLHERDGEQYKQCRPLVNGPERTA